MKIPPAFVTIAQKTLIFFLLLAAFGARAQDHLDNVKSGAPIVNALKDVYRAFAISHKIDEQQEILNLLDNTDPGALKSQLPDFIKACGPLRNQHFYNDTLGVQIRKLIDGTIKDYQVALQYGFKSKAFKTDFAAYNKLKTGYYKYFAASYPTSRFIHFTEDTYYKRIDKSNYTHSPDYKIYLSTKAKDRKAAIASLDNASKAAGNFDEYCVYQIEKADQYVKFAGPLLDPENTAALRTYKSLIDQQKYSIYLFEAWLRWRAVYQQGNGMSKTSDIPNDKYNDLREQAALTVLKYVATHLKDEMAINEFTLLATHDIVRRFGAYDYGNQNTIEYHELFDEVK